MRGLDKIFTSRPILSYAVAVFGPALLTWIRFSIEGWATHSSPFVLYSLPVILAATWGGLRPGVLASLLGLVCGQFFLVQPYNSFEIVNGDQAFALTAFLLTWLSISLLCDGLRAYAAAVKSVVAERDESKAQLDAVLDRITDYFYVVDGDWKIVHANRALADLMGRSREDIEGLTVWDLFADSSNESLKQEIRLAMDREVPTVVESLSKDTGRWYEIRMFPSPGERHLAIFVQDVTDQKTVESQTARALAAERAARSAAELSNKMKDEFVAVLSHELRTPLTSIIGWTEILSAKTSVPEDVSEGIERIKKAAHIQSRLIEDLLDVSRIVTGQLRMSRRVVDFAAVVQSTVHQLRGGHENKDRLHETIPNEPVFIMGDADRLHQVVANLITNALKFSPNDTTVRIDLRRESDQAILTISDQGDGIPANVLPNIFDPFRQANASISRKHGGLGLGLAIVKQLVELHKGKVTAESDGVGQGSTFTVSIPLTVETETVPDLSSLPIPDSIEGRRILIVEDDDGTRAMLLALLSDTGAVLEEASSAGDALEIVPVFMPEVIISDIGMPETDGYQFMRMLRKFDDEAVREIPSIALTAFAKHEDRQSAIEAGFNAHLAKPVSRDDLLRKIGKVLHI
ncbi:MAG: response regulator [Fimbriimonadaceae bacterium]|nr:response regulator [Fimbriimonadaceae bacterium]